MSTAPSPLSLPLPWNLVADHYAREIVPYFQHFARDALMLTGLKKESRVLDVACGPGTLALLAARNAARVTAVDFSPEMIAHLRARISAEGLSNVEVHTGDGQALDLTDASFDAAFSMFGLMFFPDRGRGLREIRRVLASDGSVTIASWLPLSEVPLLEAVFVTLRECMPDLPAGPERFALGTEEDVRAEIEAAGFRNVEVHRVTHPLEHPDAATFSASIQRTLAPLVLLRHKFGKEAFRPIGEAIDARILQLAGTGPVVAPMSAWIGIGRT